MKVTSVELHPAGSPNVHILSFRDPTRQNPYNVRSILGLDADNVVARYYGNPPWGQYGNPDANFHTLSMVDRQIVMDIELNPKYGEGRTYSDLRDDLYRMISSSRTGLVQIQFKDGVDVKAAISGFVSKFEANLFERNPGVKITLDTTDPTLRALAPIALVGPAIDKVDVIEAGGIKHHLDVTITDDISTAPHGLIFQLTVTGAFGVLELQGVDGGFNWMFSAGPVGGFLVGDVVHFSSERNAKQLYLDRAGTQRYFADGIVAGSIWPVIFPGENLIQFSGSHKYTLNSISYYPTYWGI